MTEAQIEMFELPNSWIWTNIGEMSEQVEKISPKEDPEKEFIYIDIASIDNKNQKIMDYKKYFGKDAPSRARQLIKTGDILFSTVRTYLKNIAIVGETYDRQIASTGFCVIRPKNLINSKLMFYYTQTHFFLNSLNPKQRGTSYPAVRNSDVFSQPFPLAPLSEQHRIVARIEELFSRLDAGVGELKKAKVLLQHHRQSVLKSAVEGRLTEEWRKAHPEVEPAEKLLELILKEKQTKAGRNYKEPSSPNIIGLPKLPEGWIWATLSQIGELNRGVSKHRPRDDPKLYGGPYPFIQTGDVRHASGVLGDYTQTYSEEGLKQSRLWPKGTLLITIAANIADTAILGFDACFPDSIVGFLTDPKKCNINFVELFIRTAKENIERYAPATAQKNINLKILSEVAVPFPPLDEQNFIVKEVECLLSIAHRTEETVKHSLNSVSHFRRSILAQAFRGKLVRQDLNDEPAIILLEKIKKERNKSKGTKEIRKRKKESKSKMSRSLYEVLSEAEDPVTAEELFSKSDYSVDSIDEFYQELREEISIRSRIKEIRPNENDVLLQVIK